jgi:transcription-repair coupling factor (superfamily II helicase)
LGAGALFVGCALMTTISGTLRISAEEAYSAPGPVEIFGAPEGADARFLADLARARGGLVLHVARDGVRSTAMREALEFFAPAIPVVDYPAWDCLPFDRASPSAAVASARMAALAVLAMREGNGPLIMTTTVNAVLQRTPPRAVIAAASFAADVGGRASMEALVAFLAANGYQRAATTREPGEYSVRGGLVDIFPPGADEPARLDFFGDVLESVRAFDPATQLTTRPLPGVRLSAATEALLSDETINRFRLGFRTAFGAVSDDVVYEAVSAGRRQAGMEHWLALFYERLDTVFDHLGAGAAIALDHQTEEAVASRLAVIADYHKARVEDLAERKPRASEFSAPVYRPLAAEALYLTAEEWRLRLGALPSRQLSPFAPPEGRRAFDLGARVGRNFAAERAAEERAVFDAVRDHAQTLARAGKRCLVACATHGSAERMAGVLADHGLAEVALAANWAQAASAPPQRACVVVLALESGFTSADAAFLSEQDILGERLIRRARRKRAENFLTEATSLSPGDLVVHVEHGVGRYAGLKTLEIQGAPHDCLEIAYAGEAKLFLPVENIELLSRFGADDGAVVLDKLGGAAWQSRKARIKARIKMLAEQLIAIAAKREMKSVDDIAPAAGAYDEFCARFPYAETEDQERAIGDVVEDLARGRPMDRLICGDVGFGKTEVALRAAFIVAMAGRQVAVIAPTTLLARQHAKNFTERFRGFPIRIGALSRLVAAKEASAVKDGMKAGQVDIVIGTHALLAQGIAFRDLGLIIVDEEQHFGVKHKERLKELRADTHVLTLTATPIPRTLQLAMSGIRDLSLIATPPVDRLAVRTTVGPFDPLVARETLLREHYRGGQSFYVAPRIADLSGVAEFLTAQVPEVRFRVAHGQMAGGELEDIMNAFYDGAFEVLVSTSIVESGLDIPTANTLIVHHADQFGLAQLYQLRGRVGRSKQRAYAYLTTSPRKALTPAADRRLKVMQSLDTLGAGFTLASHDLDLRGAGNLLGEEQSGHVKEVGVELYQHMLEEAVRAMRHGGETADDAWSPQINIGASVLIPEEYVGDLSVRMGLYRRLGSISGKADIDAFAAELVDRFGPAPHEVRQLLAIVEIMDLCKRAGIARIDAGPKGAVISFRHDQFTNIAGLVRFISDSALDVKLRPDQKLVFRQDWASERDRLQGARQIATALEAIARNA